MKKTITFLLIAVLVLSCFCIPASAVASDFSWKEYDKGYVTIVFDDGGDCTATLNSLFKKYDMPLSCAIVGNSVEREGSSLPVILRDIQNHGGEILSHTYTHSAFSQATTLADIEYEFSKSYNALKNAGFVVNGIIEAGSGGNEKKVNYDLVEQIARKYYKYSNAYGRSLQYNSERIWMNGMSLGKLKATVSRAAKNKEWVILFAHGFNEISQSNLEELLKHIDTTENIECVTYKYMYENFGNYATPQDFGDTYYTVSFTDKDGNIFEERVVAAGERISAIPENPPADTQWAEQTVIVSGNMTVSPKSDSRPQTGNEETISAASKDGNPKSITELWAVIVICVVCVIILAIVIILIVKKKK